MHEIFVETHDNILGRFKAIFIAKFDKDHNSIMLMHEPNWLLLSFISRPVPKCNI